MPALPIIIHIVSAPVSNAGALREAVWPTPVPTAIACVMTVDELSTFPILVPAACLKTVARVVTIEKHF